MVPEILSLDAFCDGAAGGAAAGIGDSRSWISKWTKYQDFETGPSVKFVLAGPGLFWLCENFHTFRTILVDNGEDDVRPLTAFWRTIFLWMMMMIVMMIDQLSIHRLEGTKREWT